MDQCESSMPLKDTLPSPVDTPTPIPMPIPNPEPMHSTFVRDSIADAMAADPRSVPLGHATLRYADSVSSSRGIGPKSKSKPKSLPDSGTLAAAMDLCCNVPSSLNTHQHSSYDQEGRKEEGYGRPGLHTKSSRARQHTRCKLYYSIGWLAAGKAGDKAGGSNQRQLGLSLNQLSYTLLRAAQKLDRPLSEAMSIVRHKMNYFSSKISAAVTLPDFDKGSEEFGPVMTHVVAAAVTYRETRLLSAIATAGPKGSRKQLRDFWCSVMTAQRDLMHYSTALFEILDAHMGAGDGGAAVLWARRAVKNNGTLPPMRVKELLLRYAATPTLNYLPALLPLLANLSASQSLVGFMEEVGGSTYDAPVLFRRYGVPQLYLPLSMDVLRTVCVDLLAQGRLSDADVLLKCVHPFQWPYDELLLALTQAPKISERNASASDSRSAELISRSRLRQCLSVLRKREELPLPIMPIRSATAKALLAMHADAQAETESVIKPGSGKGAGAEAEADVKVGVQSSSTIKAKDSSSSRSDARSDSHQELRVMVARAIRTEHNQGREANVGRTASSAVTKLDNNNGRLLVSGSNGSSNAVSEEDVRSGLMALLTLYNLTDNSTDKREEEVVVPSTTDATSTATVTSNSALPDPSHSMAGEVGQTGEKEKEKDGRSDSAPFKWVDPESPENLFKFLSDVESLGRGAGSATGAEIGAETWTEDAQQQRTGSVGLRVQGSKKSWKKMGTYGTFFDGGGRGGGGGGGGASLPLSVLTTDSRPAATMSTTLIASTERGAIAKAKEEAGAVFEDMDVDVDVLVCRELATSLLSSVLTQISITEEGLLKLGLERGREAEKENENEKGAGGLSVKDRDSVVNRFRERERLLIRGVQKEFQLHLKGAIRALYSRDSQMQANRLFACYNYIEVLCSRILHLCGLLGDAANAAVVLEQMSLQNLMPFRTLKGKGQGQGQGQERGQGQGHGHGHGQGQGHWKVSGRCEWGCNKIFLSSRLAICYHKSMNPISLSAI